VKLFGRKKKDEAASPDKNEEGAVGLYYSMLEKIEKEYGNFIADHLERLHRPGGYEQEKRENDFMDLGMPKTYLQAFDDIRFSVEKIVLHPETRGRRRGTGICMTEWSVNGTHSRPLQGIPPTGEPTTIRGMTYTTIRDYRIRTEYTYWELPELTRRAFAR
jgi:hypothetical protein